MYDFVSLLRQIIKYCDFPVTFADEALREAFAQAHYLIQTGKRYAEALHYFKNPIPYLH